MLSKRVDQLEKRIMALEKGRAIAPKPAKKKSGGQPERLPQALEEMMVKHEKEFAHGMFFTGLAIPSKNREHFVRWSGSGGFDTQKSFEEFLDVANPEDISRFSGNFSSAEKLKIIRVLISEGPLTQKEILEKADLRQGQFYHHVKDLLSNKLIAKTQQDQYDLSPMGRVLAISFIGLINAFMK